MAEDLKKEDHDERTLKLLKKYFSFFKIHGYLPKKWKNHIIKHMDLFFAYRDQIAEEMQKKDDTMDALSLDEILDIINDLADAWDKTANQLIDILETQETERAKLEKSFQSLYDMIEGIFTAQENYDWFTWGEVDQNRIKVPFCYFSANETKSFSGSTLTVETAASETSYTNGVLTLPAYLG